MRIFNESFFGQSNDTLYRLLMASFVDPQFASVLYNMKNRVASTLADLNISVIQMEASEHPDQLDDYNLGYDNHLAVFACKSFSQDFRMYIDSILQRVEWLDLDIFATVLDTALGLSHIEQTLLLSQKHPEKTLAEISALSIYSLAHEALTHAAVSSKKIELDLEFGNQLRINKTDFLTSVVASITLLGTQEVSVYNKVTFELFTNLNEVFNQLAINYKAMSTKTKSVSLIFCDDQKYNTAHAHLNDNKAIGNVDLPVSAFNPLVYANYSDDGDFRQTVIAQIKLPMDTDIDTVIQSIDYSLSTQCACEHDCCGCSSESYSAIPIQGNYFKLARYSYRNI